MSKDDWYLDKATPADIACITNDWAASEAVERREPWLSEEVFKVGIRGRIARILQAWPAACIRPTERYYERRGLVPEHDSPLFAWAAYGWDDSTQMPVVHFIYVKGPFRENGLAKVLVAEAAGATPDRLGWTTHMRRWLAEPAARLGLEPNPFLLEQL